MSTTREAVAEAICEANGVQKWAGIPQHHDYYRRMAQAAIDALVQAGCALVDRKTLEQLTECYGDEFVDGLRVFAREER